MKVFQGTGPPKSCPRCVLIGFFDGVHLGHQMLIGSLRSLAKINHLRTLAFAFDTHPNKVLRPDQMPELLTTLDERLELLDKSGLDECWLLPFTVELARISPREFCKKVLVENIDCQHLVAGEGFALGHGRSGNIAILRKLGEDLGFGVTEIPLANRNGNVVSSSRIRQLLKEGAVEKAQDLLTRPYSLGGRVISGNGLGRQIGFPTLNLASDKGKLIPRHGVYSGRAFWPGENNPMIANIGIRPTIDDKKELSIEAHLLDFNGSIETKRFEIQLMHFLRPEQKFGSLELLTQQICRDVEMAHNSLNF